MQGVDLNVNDERVKIRDKSYVTEKNSDKKYDQFKLFIAVLAKWHIFPGYLYRKCEKSLSK